MIKMIFTGALVAAMTLASCSLGGCASVASFVSTTAGKLSGPVPGQATKLADAIQLADLATKTTKLAVDSAKLPRATLIQISAGNDAVHAAIDKLEADNAGGVSLDFSAFNAALAAYNAYAVSVGVGKTG